MDDLTSIVSHQPDIVTWGEFVKMRERAEAAEAMLQQARFLAQQHEAGVPTLVDLLELLTKDSQ